MLSLPLWYDARKTLSPNTLHRQVTKITRRPAGTLTHSAAEESLRSSCLWNHAFCFGRVPQKLDISRVWNTSTYLPGVNVVGVKDSSEQHSHPASLRFKCSDYSLTSKWFMSQVDLWNLKIDLYILQLQFRWGKVYTRNFNHINKFRHSSCNT